MFTLLVHHLHFRIDLKRYIIIESYLCQYFDMAYQAIFFEYQNWYYSWRIYWVPPHPSLTWLNLTCKSNGIFEGQVTLLRCWGQLSLLFSSSRCEWNDQNFSCGCGVRKPRSAVQTQNLRSKVDRIGWVWN